MDWDRLARDVLGGQSVTRETALAVLRSSDDELLAVLYAAFRVRLHHHGRRVDVQMLHNAKRGACPEDCAFCSQSLRHNAEVEHGGMRTVEEIVAAGTRAIQAGAVTFCVVTSSRSPAAREIGTMCNAARTLKREHPSLRLCASLGMLSSEQAAQLAAAGVDRYNHNLESSRRFFGQITTTHRYDDRLDTIRAAKAVGMEICCGGILGMGETLEDRVDLALAIRQVGASAVPVNFLDPRPGTPLANRRLLSPMDCLRALAMFRFVHPGTDLRAAGGRELCLRSLQPLALFVVNSIFSDGYLTTSGQGHAADRSMIGDAGFEATTHGG